MFLQYFISWWLCNAHISVAPGGTSELINCAVLSPVVLKPIGEFIVNLLIYLPTELCKLNHSVGINLSRCLSMYR